MNAVAYLRVSTRDQSDRGYSLPTQRQAIQDYADRTGLELVEIIEEDQSGLDTDRPQLGRLCEMLQSGQADAVIAHDPDRLTREPLHYAMLRDEWHRLGVRLHFVTQGEVDLDNTGAQIIQDIRARIAKDEIKKLTERCRRGKRGKVASGKVIVAQRPPFGYRLENDALVINEAEAEIVRLIFDLYIREQKSIREIAAHLTAQQVPTRADKDPNVYKEQGRGRWAKNTVSQILKRETYTGVWHWGKTDRKWVVENGKKIRRMVEAPREQWIAVEVPAIIDHATFDQAAKRAIHNKKMAGRQTKRDYLMSRRLTCGVCGASVYADGRHAAGDVRLYYGCSSKHSATNLVNCGAAYFRVGEVDARVWEWVRDLLSDPDLMIAILDENIKSARASQVDYQAQYTDTQAQIVKIERKLARLLDIYIDEEWSKGVFETKRAELDRERIASQREADRLAKLLHELPDSDEVIELSRTIRLYQDSFILDEDPPFKVRRAWVDALNVRGKLYKVGNERKIKVSCDLLQSDVWIGTQPPRRFGHILKIEKELEVIY